MMNKVAEVRAQVLRDIKNHLGACTTKGKTDQEIAHIDEQFFLACKHAESNGNQPTARELRLRNFPKRCVAPVEYVDLVEKFVSESQDFS